MMADLDNLIIENQDLRERLELYRQREVDTLRAQVADLTEAVQHFRAEAQRNADLGRQIAADYERKISDLTAKAQVYEHTHAKRFGR